ncbi:MAG TPA: SGNH/GDSL hydrolase family protein [Rhodanobacteraceae bacterium]
MSRRFLALGDSYTIGEGVAEAARWPMQLATRLRAAGLAIDDPQIIAVTGWTTDELATGMDDATFTPPYALVTLLIGVNNQYRGRDAADYRAEFRALLARAITLAGDDTRHVLVVSIPDWGVTRFAREQGRDGSAIAVAIDVFNAAAHAEAEHAGSHWIDITAISRQCGDAAHMLATDGLHPSAVQYEHWLQRITPAARHALAA